MSVPTRLKRYGNEDRFRLRRDGTRTKDYGEDRVSNGHKRERVDETLDQPKHVTAVPLVQLAAVGVHRRVGVAEKVGVTAHSGARVGAAR
jgi:hypothetical protein